MGEAKRKRAKLNQSRKKNKTPVVRKTTEFHRKELSWLCNQFAYGKIRPK